MRLQRKSSQLMAKFDRPKTDQTTTIGVIADTHVREDDTNDKYLRRAIHDINARNVDAVVHAGDLTGDGRPAEFDRFDTLRKELSAPLHIIPGNHDLPKSFNDHPTFPFAEFENRYAPNGVPFVQQVGGIDLIGLNSAGTDEFLFDTHDGQLAENQLEWLDETLAEASTPVIAVHHNLPALMNRYRDHRDAMIPDHDDSPPVLRASDPFVESLASYDVSLLLTGHMHIPAVTEMESIREVSAPSTQTFPPGYLLITFGPDGTSVRLEVVADQNELRRVHRERRESKRNAEILTDMTTVQMAGFPLVDRR